MIEYLEKIDHCIVLSVNGRYTPILGQCMWFLSGKLTWIPLYILLIFLAKKKLQSISFYWFLVFAILSIALSDLTCTHLFKNVFQRYRPSHNTELLPKLHLYYQSTKHEFYQGGKFGFVSSHAANFFALAVFVGLVLKNYYKYIFLILLFIAVLVSFTRLYLGVHYLSDLIGGALVGIFYAFICFKIFSKYFR